jgi:hypothetical protein
VVVDISGIDERHCLEVIVCFFDTCIGGIDGHHSLNILHELYCPVMISDLILITALVLLTLIIRTVRLLEISCY